MKLLDIAIEVPLWASEIVKKNLEISFEIYSKEKRQNLLTTPGDTLWTIAPADAANAPLHSTPVNQLKGNLR